MININKTTVCVDIKRIDLSHCKWGAEVPKELCYYKRSQLNLYKENTGTLFADTLERSTTALEVYTFFIPYSINYACMETKFKPIF